MMTKQQIQREANKTNRACWYATGDGGGWWIQPNQKTIKRNQIRRQRYADKMPERDFYEGDSPDY